MEPRPARRWYRMTTSPLCRNIKRVFSDRKEHFPQGNLFQQADETLDVFAFRFYKIQAYSPFFHRENLKSATKTADARIDVYDS
jgi:hypothetical protein